MNCFAEFSKEARDKHLIWNSNLLSFLELLEESHQCLCLKGLYFIKI